MIPRPAHIQGQLGQGIESLDVRGQKTVDRLADRGLLAHGLSIKFVLTGIPSCCGDAARMLEGDPFGLWRLVKTLPSAAFISKWLPRPHASFFYDQDRDFCILMDYTIGNTAEDRGC